MEKENKLEKVGSFVSSTISKIVNAIIVVLILALVGVIGWFWHLNDKEKTTNETLQKQVEDLKIELEEVKKEKKDLEVKNVVKEFENKENVVKNEVIEEKDKTIKKNVGDYYCEKDNDCAIKTKENCCGGYSVCVNKNANFDEENQKIKENCYFMGVSSTCGSENIDSCKCMSNKCESF